MTTQGEEFDPYEARVGEQLRGKWRLERLLGVGGAAAVYAAVHRNGKQGAVKILHAELKHEPVAKERFFYEGLVSNKVEHEGVVAVLDDDITDDGVPFLVMELLDGEPLDAKLERLPAGRMDPRVVCRIGLSLLEVLAAAHDKGVVHRDIKPENLFLTTDGRFKLLDFGIARLNDEASKSSTKTRFGIAMGTPAYMPPEQAAGEWDLVDARSDIWAVGATLFRLLTGSYVHEAESMHKTLRKAMVEPAAPIRTHLPDLKPEVAAVIDRALAFEQDDRFGSARAMREALAAALPEVDAMRMSGAYAALHIEAGPTSLTPVYHSDRKTSSAAASARTLVVPKARRVWPWIVGAAALAALSAATVVLQSRSASDRASASGRATTAQHEAQASTAIPPTVEADRSPASEAAPPAATASAVAMPDSTVDPTAAPVSQGDRHPPARRTQHRSPASASSAVSPPSPVPPPTAPPAADPDAVYKSRR